MTFEASADNRQCIEITIISDTISENSESFTATVEVRSDSGVTLGTPSTATITITGRYGCKREGGVGVWERGGVSVGVHEWVCVCVGGGGVERDI